MAENSNIGWTTHTWNTATGCTKVSPGCGHCYAEARALRFKQSFTLRLMPKNMTQPLKWDEGALIFVNSTSDTFHSGIPDDYLKRMYDVMLEVDQHIYQVLTKRPHRMAYKIEQLGLPTSEHIWLGTSVENQEWADHRIPVLASIDTPIRWLSCEPLLGPVDIAPYADDLRWIVTGGESGPRRTPADYDWFRQIRDACLAAGIPFFHKQGNHLRPGNDRELDGRTWDGIPGPPPRSRRTSTVTRHGARE